MISASSDGAGRGTIFSVRLPVHPTPVDETDLQRVRQRVVPLGDPLGSRADHSLKGIDVLVVDDKEDSLDMLRQLLEHAGATVRTAASGTDALVQWKAHQPDLVVADIGLPVMDGYQLLRELRAHSSPTGRVVPALAVTAYAMDADRAKANAAGFQGHVAKPVDPDAFIAAAAAIAHQYT